jgi:hypothetical protein
MSAATDSNTNKIRVFVRLLEEGTEVSRPTEALELGNGLFKLLPTADYDPQAEVWEFPPGSIIRCASRRDDSGEYVIAIQS